MKHSNPWLGLIVTIALPAIILTRLSGPAQLGPVWGLVVALAFPIGWGLWRFFEESRVDALAGIGITGILLTGGIGLLQLPADWIAVKEAAVPLVIGLLIVGSFYTRFSVVDRLLGGMLNMEIIDRAVRDDTARAAYQSRLRSATFLIGGSFLLSAVLNYWLARVLVTAEAGTVEFNQQLGRLTALSYPVIALPSVVVLVAAVMYLLRGVERLTGLDAQDLIRTR